MRFETFAPIRAIACGSRKNGSNWLPRLRHFGPNAAHSRERLRYWDADQRAALDERPSFSAFTGGWMVSNSVGTVGRMLI